MRTNQTQPVNGAKENIKRPNKPRIVSIKTLRKMNYEELDLGDFYNKLLGKMESRSRIFIYGTSGSGKSVFTLQLSDYFALNIGKVLYCSHEEALKKTLKDRSIFFNIDSPKLYVGEYINFDYLMEKVKKNHYRMVIIDSVQYAQFTAEQLRKMNDVFRKRKLIIIPVSFGTAYKKPTCDNEIMHACDVKLFFDAGVLTVDSRYLMEVKKTRLFVPKQSNIQSPTLF